ncbi:hypothetical protein A4D02_21225 [Niastella koreensis]|uniref:Uncharacterized protein n=1 Tax=Niastella koreensis TaxID=354356 RepID=A0ABX3P139_9BACT|nr:hypothetical protein [Niastella koreensis]OQP52934.1 hypothetical protein A4D02_21225 [Niastella koreensis]
MSKIYTHYDYLVIADPVFTGQIKGGLRPEEIVEQFGEIDLVNKTLGRQFIKKGLNVPILQDGSLGLPAGLLQQGDWVTAFIAGDFNKDITSRLIWACENPYVQCLNHPDSRPGVQKQSWTVNWKKVIDKAAATGTCIAINAQPDQQAGLKEDWIKYAIERGAKICIGTNASYLYQFDFISTGVAAARRGWCRKEDILNTRSWKEIESYKQYKQSVLSHHMKDL